MAPDVATIPSPPGVPTAEDLGILVELADDEQLGQLFRGMGPDEVLARVFEDLPDRFDPTRAAGVTAATVQWVASLDGQRYPWIVEVAGTECRVRPGMAEQPIVTMDASLPDVIRVMTGRMLTTRGFLGGELAITGDVVCAMQLQGWFGLS